MMSMIAMLLVWTPRISMVLMMIALVMMKMSPINMSIFVECIGFASTHQIGKIDIARGISTYKLNCCKKVLMIALKDSIFFALLVNFVSVYKKRGTLFVPLYPCMGSLSHGHRHTKHDKGGEPR